MEESTYGDYVFSIFGSFQDKAGQPVCDDDLTGCRKLEDLPAPPQFHDSMRTVNNSEQRDSPSPVVIYYTK